MSLYTGILGAGGEAEAASLEGELPCLRTKVPELEQRVTQAYEELRGGLYRYLVLVTGGIAEAEEVTQEAFLQLYRCLLAGQDIRNVRSWIFRVAHNQAVNRAARGHCFVPMDADLWERVSELRQDPAPDPEQQVIEREKHGRLREDFRALSPLQRQCLMLRADGFRYEQIAEILGSSVANVAQSLHRGIRKLMRDRHA